MLLSEYMEIVLEVLPVMDFFKVFSPPQSPNL